MDRVTVDPRRRAFLRGGEEFFYLADTLWMAFSKLDMREWEEILRVRRLQRFNVLQISALPIAHDDSRDAGALAAFLPGSFELSGEYLDRACAMLARANEFGFTPCVHLLWANYVPDTWAAERPTGTPMEYSDAMRAVEALARRFRPYAPIYSISGDTKFETQRVADYYAGAIGVVRAVDPGALLTLHLAPGADVPDRLCGMVDFYSYQGSHGAGKDFENHFRFGLHYCGKPGAKPVVNSEPPYEGHGHAGAAGRFGAADVRCAVWQSLLSGASAGVSYGAHGLWSVHRAGQSFSSVPFSNMPFDWHAALRLPGAWDAANARALCERHGLIGIAPYDGLDERFECIRMAATEDRGTIAVYAPYACDVHLKGSLEGYGVVLYDLATLRRMNPELADGGTTLLMPDVNGDLLYIATRR